MMEKQSKKTYLIFSAILVLAATLVWVGWKMSYKIGYVDQVKLFNEFRMKKVLEAEFQKVENMRKSQLDSLGMVLSMMERQAISKPQLQYLYEQKEAYGNKAQEFAEMNETLKDQFNEQIWNQLNQYIKDYADQHQYDYVLGGAGDGVVMFARNGHHITDPLIEYVNKRFDGKSK